VERRCFRPNTPPIPTPLASSSSELRLAKGREEYAGGLGGGDKISPRESRRPGRHDAILSREAGEGDRRQAVEGAAARAIAAMRVSPNAPRPVPSSNLAAVSFSREAGEGGAEGDGRGRPYTPALAAAPSTSQRLVPLPRFAGEDGGGAKIERLILVGERRV
jgi:hypothetical protein